MLQIWVLSTIALLASIRNCSLNSGELPQSELLALSVAGTIYATQQQVLLQPGKLQTVPCKAFLVG